MSGTKVDLFQVISLLLAPVHNASLLHELCPLLLSYPPPSSLTLHGRLLYRTLRSARNAEYPLYN